MSDEFDIFAQGAPAKPQDNQPKEQRAEQPQGANAARRAQFRKPGKPRHQAGAQKVNASPIRGANGQESVNPLMNAPLPAETRDAVQEAPVNLTVATISRSTGWPTSRRGRRSRSSTA